mgnify:CR=1
MEKRKRGDGVELGRRAASPDRSWPPPLRANSVRRVILPAATLQFSNEVHNKL